MLKVLRFLLMIRTKRVRNIVRPRADRTIQPTSGLLQNIDTGFILMTNDDTDQFCPQFSFLKTHLYAQCQIFVLLIISWFTVEHSLLCAGTKVINLICQLHWTLPFLYIWFQLPLGPGNSILCYYCYPSVAAIQHYTMSTFNMLRRKSTWIRSLRRTQALIPHLRGRGKRTVLYCDTVPTKSSKY